MKKYLQFNYDKYKKKVICNMIYKKLIFLLSLKTTLAIMNNSSSSTSTSNPISDEMEIITEQKIIVDEDLEEERILLTGNVVTLMMSGQVNEAIEYINECKEIAIDQGISPEWIYKTMSDVSRLFNSDASRRLQSLCETFASVQIEEIEENTEENTEANTEENTEEKKNSLKHRICKSKYNCGIIGRFSCIDNKMPDGTEDPDGTFVVGFRYCRAHAGIKPNLVDPNGLPIVVGRFVHGPYRICKTHECKKTATYGVSKNVSCIACNDHKTANLKNLETHQCIKCHRDVYTTDMICTRCKNPSKKTTTHKSSKSTE